MNPPTNATAIRNDSTVTVNGNHEAATNVAAVIELGVANPGFVPVNGFRTEGMFPPNTMLMVTFINVPAPPQVTHCRISRQDNPASFVVIPIANDVMVLPNSPAQIPPV